MAHHRCTRCKQESYPRHKYAGGLFCEDCLKELGRGRRRWYSGFTSIFSRIWEFITAPFRPNTLERQKQKEEKANYHRMKQMESRARHQLPSHFRQDVVR